MSKIIYGSIEKKIYSSDLLLERANKNFTGSLDEAVDSENYRRTKESVAFMESHPGLRNSHTFYDMTKEEQMKAKLKKVNLAYRLGKDKWFVNHQPH